MTPDPDPHPPEAAFLPGLCLGLVLGLFATEAWHAPGPLAADARFAALRARYALPAEPRRWNARELRLLPGVGERRALDTVRARRAHAASGRVTEPLRWEDVPGIGERTAAGVREALRARGAAWLEAGGLPEPAASASADAP